MLQAELSFLTAHELHSRSADGIQVRLLWCEHSDRLAVTVADQKTGDAFAVDVTEREHAMHVFNHPFAYAA